MAALQPAAAAVKAQPAAAPQSAVVSDDRALWNLLLKAFQPSPFIYDVMTNCAVHFAGDNWSISFGPGKEFYKIPAQNKLADLEKKALQLGGRKIKFSIVVGKASHTATASAAAAAAKTPSDASVPLTDEEPLVQADFSADVAPAAASGPVPEELKGILDVIGGEVLA